MSSEWLTAEESAGVLGVKPETLYAYVSRGLVERERIPGDRRSRYRRTDIERFAARQRSGAGRAGGLEILIETSLTLLEPEGRLFYRGWEVGDAARSASFETVATWLWTGDRMSDPQPFDTPTELAREVGRVTAALGPAPVDRIRAVLAAVRSLDPLRHDRRPSAVAAHGRAIVAIAVDALPALGSPIGDSVAARLWSRLTERRPTRRDIELLDATLVLLADHELAASTLAARVAASAWAGPYLFVLAGLATLGGPLHGGASEQARALLVEIRDRVPAAEAVDARLADGHRIPGFGHSVYVTCDPRADVLLDDLFRGRSNPSLRAGRDLLAVMDSRGLPFPNIDLALAVLTEAHAMVPNAGIIIFAVARIAGWLAHAIEEYEYRLRFRPRAVYVGLRD